jgi:two-component system sensor histidine kinase/response regulator
VDQQCILVVEDHSPLRAGIQAILEAEGYCVVTAVHGAQALDVLEKVRPDLIVADIMMPQMDGYAFYEAVRSQPTWTMIPFVFLTAKATKNDILKGKALGVEDYLTKPFDADELVVTVRARLRRNEAIQTAAKAEFDQLKQQIAAVLGHELRTPLTYVKGYAGVALESIASLSPKELEECLSQIRSGADRLAQRVNDLLLLVQLDTGQAARDFATVAEVSQKLDAIVAQTIREFEERAAACGLTLERRVDPNLPPVQLSAPLFVDALGRLIDNAIKFSHGRGKQVTVGAWATRGWVEVAVSDEGVGIASEDIPHLFQRFWQIDRERREQQGLGLGLSIAQELIRLHAGNITVKSILGGGSTFTILLPMVGELPEETWRHGS